MQIRTIVVFVLAAFIAVPAFAQDGSSWGVQVGVDPQWQPLEKVSDLLPGEMSITGRDLSIGVVRGTIRGGDWGVSFVKSSLDDASTIGNVTEICPPPDLQPMFQCEPAGSEYALNNASMTGFRVHWYKPFVTVADRVQIGINGSVGAAWLKGTAEKTEYGSLNGEPMEYHSTVSAKDAVQDVIGLPVVPLGRLELAGAVILTENVKVKAAGGIGFPGYSRFNVGVTYLF